jgi:hypothetical protein
MTPLRPALRRPVVCTGASWCAWARAGVSRVDVDPPPLPSEAGHAKVSPAAAGASAATPREGEALILGSSTGLPPVAAQAGSASATPISSDRLAAVDGWGTSVGVHLPSEEDEPVAKPRPASLIGEDGVEVDPPQGSDCTAGGVEEERSRPPLPDSTHEDKGDVESPRRGTEEGDIAGDDAEDAHLASTGVTRPRVNTLPLAGLSVRGRSDDGEAELALSKAKCKSSAETLRLALGGTVTSNDGLVTRSFATISMARGVCGLGLKGVTAK